MRSIKVLRLVMAVCAGGMLSGCLERFETITVSPNGDVALRTEFRGTPEDFVRPSDPLPEAGGRWAYAQREEREPDGKMKLVRVVELNVPSGQALPQSYAPEGDARALTGLTFPTTLRVTPMGAYTYYEFERVYKAREDARFSYGRKAILESDEIKKLKDRKPESFTDDERRSAARALCRAEADRQAQFVVSAAAVLEREGTWGTEIGLVLRSAALAAGDTMSVEHLVSLLRQGESPDRDGALAKALREIGPEIERMVMDTLARMGDKGVRAPAFAAAYAHERARREATEHLGDERWVVRVKLPGTLAAHNAQRVEAGELVWEFPAEALMDRDHVLRAVSWIGPSAGDAGK